MRYLNKLNREELREELFRLMDEVRLILEKQDDVDDFLANTNLFDVLGHRNISSNFSFIN